MQANDVISPKDEKAIEREIKKYVENLLRQARKLIDKQHKYMTENNETTEALLLFLKKQPEAFATEFGIYEREMFKWALNENCKQNRRLIKKIKELEVTYNLPFEYED